MQYLYIIISFFAINLSTLDYSKQDIEIQDPTFTEEQMKTVRSIIEGVTDEDIDSLDGGKLYKQNCTTCHGRKGGLGISGATNLKKSTLGLDQQVAMMYFGKGKMLSYKNSLNPAEMIAIGNFLNTLRK